MADGAEHAVKACLITNPRSGRGGIDLTEPLAVLRAQGWDVVVREKLHGGGATKLAREAVADGYTVVVDCGGDGTLNEIVNGVVGTDAAVGTLPGGTANLWAHEVGISQRLRVAATQLAGAERRRVDVGRVSVSGGHGEHFLLMAGLGFDAEVVSRVKKPLKNRIGQLAVCWAAAGALRSFRATTVRVEMDGVSWEGGVTQLLVGNTRRYAGWTRITADAFMDDGLLDLCLITAKGPLSVSRQLASLLFRQRPSGGSAETYRAAEVVVRAPHALPLQIDGGMSDLNKKLPSGEVEYTFSLIAQGVTMLVPRTYDGTLFQPGRPQALLAAPPLRPVPVDGAGPAAHSGNGHHAPRHAPAHSAHEAATKDRHADPSNSPSDAPKGKRLRVLAVGIDTFTAVRLKNGQVVTVKISPRTLVDDAGGEPRSLWGALSTLAEGDIVRVRGSKDAEHPRTLLAARVALEPLPAARG